MPVHARVRRTARGALLVPAISPVMRGFSNDPRQRAGDGLASNNSVIYPVSSILIGALGTEWERMARPVLSEQPQLASNMDNRAANHTIGGIVRDLESSEHQFTTYLATVKKAKDRLVAAKNEIPKGKPVTRLTSLIADLRAVSAVPAPNLPQLIAELERHVRLLAESFGGTITNELRQHAEAQKMSFKPLSEGFVLGPFAVTLNVPKESANLTYAKVPLVSGMPLDPSLIVKTAQEWMAKLLEVPAFQSLAVQFEEAIRVAVARQKKPAARADLRADLLAVYREMTFIRQGPGREHAKAADYCLPRFVVELKTLVQSEENTQGDRRFRLETAVLENAKDPRKSVFIPSDLSAGHGEGTYFQAIAMLSEG